MIFKGENENRIYVVIAIFIIALIFITVLFSSNDINEAYIKDITLGQDWYEDVSGRFSDVRSFGLEKQVSFIYKTRDSNYPAFLTVNTFKTLFMMDEEDLLEKTVETIENAVKEKNVSLNGNSKIQDARVLNNGHKTMYIVYNGTKTSENNSDEVKIIGETWNCRESGTSIIVIGYAQTTNNSNNMKEENLIYWAKIIRDKKNTFDFCSHENIFIGDDGLIFNVKCH